MRRWLPTAIVTALAALMGMGRALLTPWAVAVGDPNSEAPGHLWGLWATAQGIFPWGPLVRYAEVGAPQVFFSHLIDPINLVFFLPFYWLGFGSAAGAILGWNAVHLGSILLGAWGCHRLAPRLAPDEDGLGSAILALAFVASPFMLYHPEMGRTEMLPAMFLPAHLSFLHDFLQPGRRDWRAGLIAGALAGCVGLGGGYVGTFSALVIPFIALAWAAKLGLKEAGLRLAAVAAVGLLICAPGIWAMKVFPPSGGQLNRGGPETVVLPPQSLAPLFRMLPPQNVGWPQMDEFPFAGLIGMGLAVISAVKRPKNLAWVVLAMWALVCAFGPGLGQWSPGWKLQEWVPFTRAIATWSRMGVVAALPAGVAAMLAFATLVPQRFRLPGAIGLGLLMLGDQATWPNRWKWPDNFDPRAPDELLHAMASLPEGMVVELPVELPGPKGAQMQAAYFLWQLQHGRHISATPHNWRDGTLKDIHITRSVTFKHILARGAVSRIAPREGELEDPDCAKSAINELKLLGFAGVVLHADAPDAQDLPAHATELMGEPSFHEGDIWAWDLTKMEGKAFHCPHIVIPGEYLGAG